jgi:hypothetical protein
VTHPGPSEALVLEALRAHRSTWATCDTVLGWCLDLRPRDPEARAWTAKGTSSRLQSLRLRRLVDRGAAARDPAHGRPAPTYRLRAAPATAQVAAKARLATVQRLLPLFEPGAAAEIHAALLAMRVDLQLQAEGDPPP